MGSLLIDKEIRTDKKHELSLSSQAPGIYLIKVIQNMDIGIVKVIRQ